MHYNRSYYTKEYNKVLWLNTSIRNEEMGSKT